jgi:hypothetical protein
MGVARQTGMRSLRLMIVAVLCVACGQTNGEPSADATRLANTSSPATTANTTNSITTEPSTSIADTRSSYVPVGPHRAPQLPEEALAQTVAGLSDAVRSATLGPAPNTPDATVGLWVHLETAGDGSDPVLPMEADWEASLLLGAMADRTTSDGYLSSVIKGLVIDDIASDGTATTAWQPTNNDIVAGQRFQPPGDDPEIERMTTATLTQFGLEPVSITVLHPLDAALTVITILRSPEAMNGRLAELQTILTGTPIQYEGVYLEVRLPDGSPIAKLATAFRGGRGSQWERPELEDILGGPPHG